MLYVLVDEELLALREKTVQDYNELCIRDLCTGRFGKCDVMFFKFDDKFYEMVSRITEIKRSQIFNTLWQRYSEKLKDEFVTMEDIFNKIWSIILDKLKLINEQFLDGEMQLKEVDKYLDMCKKDYGRLEEEFMLLSRYFSGTERLGEVKEKLGVSIEKLKSYKKLLDAQQAAQAILELQKVMGLEGDFAEVERIKEVRLYFLLYNFPQRKARFSQTIWVIATLNSYSVLYSSEV
jgi:phage-related tail protein